MIKSLTTGALVAFQIYLISSIGAKLPQEMLYMVLILATVPFLREPAAKAFEDMEKERAKKQKEEK